uniref:Uncharacterized protein n=1 Tax=Anopheles quadriannulatus TaxID=34691 RepID=A0A182XPY0_ANOQN
MPADKKFTKLTKVYKDRRTWMEEFVDFVDNYKDSEQRVELQSQLKALEGAKDAYEEARENLLIEDEEADEVQMRTDRRDFFKKFHQVRGFIMDMLKTDESVQPIANSTMANTTTVSVKMRLPKLELPTFDGMKRLEEPTQHWNTPLTTLVMYKFDNTTLIAYEHFAVENKTDTYDLLMEFCEKRIPILNSTALHSIGVIGTRSATKAYQRNRFPDQ